MPRIKLELEPASISSPRSCLRLTSLLLLLCACQGKDGLLTDADDSGDETATTAGTDDTAPTTDDTDTTLVGTAFLRADKPPPPGSEPPPSGAPDDLLVDVGDFALACADPYGYPACAPRTFYRFSFVLSPGRQQPGTYLASDLGATIDFQSEQDSPCERNGPFDIGGTVEVVSFTADQLVVRLTDAETTFATFDGEYSVVRCAG